MNVELENGSLQDVFFMVEFIQFISGWCGKIRILAFDLQEECDEVEAEFCGELVVAIIIRAI